ncbi:MAG: diaminopimelate epimerase [archaeon]|nr:diaminopimelate epimerase [archaeon]
MEGLGNRFCVLDGFNKIIASCFFETCGAAAEQRVHTLLASLSGCGVVGLGLPNPGLNPDWPKVLITELCRLHDTDGLLVPTPSAVADIRMVYYNKDGSRAAMCGNGLRCVARYSGLPEGLVETDCGLRRFRVTDGGLVAVEMGEPLVTRDLLPLSGLLVGPLSAEERTHRCALRETAPQQQYGVLRNSLLFRVDVGNPHLVFLLPPSLDEASLRAAPEFSLLGPALEKDPAFGTAGNNVELVVALPPAPGCPSLHFFQRTWERGCGETRACGSGACAVYASILASSPSVSDPVIVHMLGGSLSLSNVSDSQGHLVVWMTGDAHYVSGVCGS